MIADFPTAVPAELVAAAPASAPGSYAVVSIGTAAVFLTAAALLRWVRPLRRIEFLIPWFCLMAGVGLSYAFLTGWMMWLSGQIHGAIPLIGGVILSLFALAVTYVTVYDLWPGHPTNNASALCALTMPSTTVFMGGAVGGIATAAVAGIGAFGAKIVSAMVGVS